MKSYEDWQDNKLITELVSALDQYELGGTQPFVDRLVHTLEMNSKAWTVGKKAKALLDILRALGFQSPMQAFNAIQMISRDIRRGALTPSPMTPGTQNQRI
jgi:hypothetical protein